MPKARLQRLTWSRDGSTITVYSTDGMEDKLRGRAAAVLSALVEDFFTGLSEVLDELEQPEVAGGEPGAGAVDERDGDGHGE